MINFDEILVIQYACCFVPWIFKHPRLNIPWSEANNMLRDKDGWLKITGQGFCTPPPPKKKNCKHNTFCGTPQYLVLEVINNEEYNFSVSLWAAETLIFKMVVGYPPILVTDFMRVYEKTVAWRFSCHHFSKACEDLLSQS